MANSLGGWLAIIGGIVAGIGQWYPDAWLPLIGGIVALVGGITSLSNK